MNSLTRWPSERRPFRDPVTGTQIEQLTAYPAHHWHLSTPDTPLTPAGDYLLFTSDRDGGPQPDLFRLEVRTGAIQQVTGTDRLDPRGVTPAANGRQAIAALSEEEGEVVAIDLETGDRETLAVFLRARLDGCHRSASGEYGVTVVTREDEVTITAVHTEGMRTVPILGDLRGANAARFSPDSKNSVLYVTPEPAAIRCVEFDGTGDRELYSGVQADSVVRSSYPARSKAGPPSSDTHYEIRNMPEPRIACPPSWLGTGDEVLFIGGAGLGPVMAVPRQGGRPREICGLRCRWVRSNGAGDQIVASISEAIVLLDPRSGRATPLCSRVGAEARPCFSPDGRAVVFSDCDERGCSQLFIAFLDER